jgi:ABC-type multidrug transport system ATPase subunit
MTRRRPVLRAQTLELPESGNVGLVGINGAGKSTLMLELAGLLCSDRTPAAFSPQRPTFPDWLACLDTTRMFGFEYDALEAAFPALLLDEIRRVRGGALSVGQAQALSVALALYPEADMTLLDEPFAPLDFRRRIALSNILRERRAPGIVMISSQSAAELLDVCSWVVVLRGGDYVFSGSIASIIADATGDSARAALEERVIAML